MVEFPDAIIEKQGYLDPHITILNNNLRLNEPVWDDLRVPVNSVKVPAASYPDWVAYKGGLVLAFGDQAVEGNEEIVYFTVQMPHNWKTGSNILPHVHWTVDDTGSGDAVWKLTYSWANINSVFPTETPDTITDTFDGTSGKHLITSFNEIDASGMNLSSMLICSLRRNSSNAADTLTSQDIILLEIDIHYQIDRLGSKYEISN